MMNIVSGDKAPDKSQGEVNIHSFLGVQRGPSNQDLFVSLQRSMHGINTV